MNSGLVFLLFLKHQAFVVDITMRENMVSDFGHCKLWEENPLKQLSTNDYIETFSNLVNLNECDHCHSDSVICMSASEDSIT